MHYYVIMNLFTTNRTTYIIHIDTLSGKWFSATQWFEMRCDASPGIHSLSPINSVCGDHNGPERLKSIGWERWLILNNWSNVWWILLFCPARCSAISNYIKRLATVESNRKALINFYFCLNDFSEEIETTCGICIINIILMRLLSVYPVDISSIEW